MRSVALATRLISQKKLPEPTTPSLVGRTTINVARITMVCQGTTTSPCDPSFTNLSLNDRGRGKSEGNERPRQPQTATTNTDSTRPQQYSVTRVHDLWVTRKIPNKVLIKPPDHNGEEILHGYFHFHCPTT